MTWQDKVGDSLDRLGGSASNAELYDDIGESCGKSLSTNEKAKVRQTLQLHFFPLARGLWANEAYLDSLAEVETEPPLGPSPADVMLARIRAMLLQASSLLNRTYGLDTDARTVANADVSIDGELRVRSIAHGKTIISILLNIEQSIYPIEKVEILGSYPRPWISIVQRYSAPEGATSPDSRYRGLAEAITNASDASRQSKIAQVLATAREVARNVQLKRKKPEQVLVRIYWDPAGTRPKREYNEK